jgi:hypothetical protein
VKCFHHLISLKHDRQDWIETHGPRGGRHVAAWSPVVLARRASQYLTEVLRYLPHRPYSTDLTSFRWSFPPVSSSFVAYNGLETAVQEGVLNMIQDNSGQNLASDLPKAEVVESKFSETDINELDGPKFATPEPRTRLPMSDHVPKRDPVQSGTPSATPVT